MLSVTISCEDDDEDEAAEAAAIRPDAASPPFCCCCCCVDRRGLCMKTFSAVVAAARHGWRPSNSPMATRPGSTFWFRCSVNTGLNMASEAIRCSGIDSAAPPSRYALTAFSVINARIECFKAKLRRLGDLKQAFYLRCRKTCHPDVCYFYCCWRYFLNSVADAVIATISARVVSAALVAIFYAR